jgi:uncharacterized protein (TIGR03437 family)
MRLILGLVAAALLNSAAPAAPGRLSGKASVLRSFAGLNVRALRTDSLGNLYIAGVATASGLPTTPGAVASDWQAGNCATIGPAHLCTDLYVAVLDSTGAVTFGSYVGGARDEEFVGMDVSASGVVSLSGTTTLDPFPTTAPPLSDVAITTVRSFLMTLRTRGEGSALRSSIILGDHLVIQPRAVAVDAQGRTYLAGFASDRFPATTGAFQTTPGNTSHNAFLLRLAADGVTLEYATYLAGSATDDIYRLAAGPNGDVYAAGVAQSANFPSVPGSYVNVPKSGFVASAFVARFHPESGRFVYIAHLAGSDSQSPVALAVDAEGSAYLAGSTSSDDLPVTTGGERLGVMNPFVARLSPDGARLLFSTFLGGEGYDTPTALFLEPEGTVVLAGTAGSRLARLTADAHEPCNSAAAPTQYTGFLARLQPGDGALAYASYFTVGMYDTAIRAAALDRDGRLVLVSPGDPLDLSRNGGPVHVFVRDPGDHVIRIDPGEAAPGVTCMMSAASGSTEGVVAGEFVAIYGKRLAPVEAGAVRVLFDGAPATLLYSGDSQINAVVPNAVAERAKTTVEIEIDGAVRAKLEPAVLPVLPGLFRDYSGRLALALNEDGAFNSREHPAAPGSLVHLFANGDPAIVLGQPAHNARVQIGAQSAEVVFAGQAPGFIPGLVAIDILLPRQFDLPRREQNLTLYMGDAFSLGRATLAVAPK